MTNHLELRVAERTTFAGGESFGTSGAYERIAGRVRFAVDPAAKPQAGIVDIDKAARDARGLVHCTADFLLLKPVDMKNGNRRLLFDWANRGNKRCLQFFNDAPGSNDPRSLAHAGNGFLMRRGYTIAWLAWQGDLLPGDGRQILDLPPATDNGRPITGPVRVEFSADQPGVNRHLRVRTDAGRSGKDRPAFRGIRLAASASFVEQRFRKRADLFPARIRFPRQLKTGAEKISWLISELKRLHLRKTFQNKSGCNQQREGQRDFADHEPVARTFGGRRIATARRPIFQRELNVRMRNLPSRP